MSRYKRAILAFIIASIIWGAGSPISKWALQGINPLNFAFFRFAVPVIVLLPFIKALQPIKSKDIFYFILLGILDCSLNIGLYFYGLQFTRSINQPIIATSSPLFIIIGSALFLKDKASKKVLLGNIVGLTGVMFIVLEPMLGLHSNGSILGNTFFILATIAGSIGTLVSKKMAEKYNAFTLVFWTFFVAAISFLPIVITNLSLHSFWQQFNTYSITGIFYGGIFSSLVAYALFYYGLRYIKASETTIFTYIDPVAAIFIAIPLLGEFPTPIFILGSFLVFLGIYIAEGRLHWHPLHKLFN